MRNIANSFMTFDRMYEHIIKGDYSVLKRKFGTNDYPEIHWLIEHFIKKEEYEKCHILSKLQLPKVDDAKIEKEIIEWFGKINKTLT